MWWRAGTTTAVCTVATAPDAALLAAVGVLRALGARITRYDVEGLTLEARLARWGGPARVAMRAEDDGGDGGARLHVNAEARAARGLVRRIERALYTTLSRRSAAISAAE